MYTFFFVLIFYFITFFLRSYLLWRNTGISAITFDATDDAHGFNGKLFTIIATLELIVIAIYSFGGSWYEYLLPFWYLEKNYLEVIGWIFILFSLGWVVIAQIQMSDSWRIGIDQKNKTELVTQGLFTISRNPIFFGIIIANLGLFLVAPNAFTLLVAVLSYSVIQTQVRLEEDFLKESHGAIYQDYFRKVRRWI